MAKFHLFSAGILGSICKREWIIRPFKNLSVFSSANKEILFLIWVEAGPRLGQGWGNVGSKLGQSWVEAGCRWPRS